VGVVALVCHQLRPQATALARDAAAWLTERGHEVRLLENDARATGLDDLAHPAKDFACGLDLAISLGGDGTMLRTVDLVCAAGVPVLGVNVGHLGYLTEVEPEGLTDALTRFFAGAYAVEERMTLEVKVDVPDGASHVALNEAVLEKTLSGHTVRLGLTLNDQAFTAYAADGLIIATPTGSTAYNLSARGPILSPHIRALVVTPVSPHMLFDRPLVLDTVDVIDIQVIGDRPAALVVDGRQIAILEAGDGVSCRAGPHDARLVTFGGRDFHRILKAKFGLADR
jgi:NAD+ kinase